MHDFQIEAKQISDLRKVLHKAIEGLCGHLLANSQTPHDLYAIQKAATSQAFAYLINNSNFNSRDLEQLREISNHLLRDLPDSLSLSEVPKHLFIDLLSSINKNPIAIHWIGHLYEGLLDCRLQIVEGVQYLHTSKGGLPMCLPHPPKKSKGVSPLPEGAVILSDDALERKQAAAFYTPEVLTRFLARESVELLLKGNDTLERMESLKICEPAMGSGAFLNAVVDEIASKIALKYRKKAEDEYKAYETACFDNGTPCDKTKAAKELPFYVSKAKNHLMQKCVFGVDLNPTAVELAKVSLWLNCLHKDGNLPFLDFKLRLGNSLIGAWINQHRNEHLNCPHFLIPKVEALNPHFEGKVLGDNNRPFLTPEQRTVLQNVVATWSITRGLNPQIEERVRTLCVTIDNLYQSHVKNLTEYRKQMNGAQTQAQRKKHFYAYKECNSPYHQLRSMMDYWCALWFWPYQQIHLVPKLDRFLEGLEWLSKADLAYGGRPKAVALEKSKIPQLVVANEVALRSRFFHWDLEFADVFEDGGFDLVLGNPPWAPVKWEEEDFFTEANPGLRGEIVGLDAAQKRQRYRNAIERQPDVLIPHYKEATIRVKGLGEFLKESETYPYKDSSSTNTYRYFYQRFRSITKQGGLHAMIAQDGIVSDQGCIQMRPDFYRDLVRMCRFQNRLKLFKDVDGQTDFATIFCAKGKQFVGFDLIDNLYHPDTVSKCFKENELAPYPGMRNEDGKVNLRGHPDRVTRVDSKVLAILSEFHLNAESEDSDEEDGSKKVNGKEKGKPKSKAPLVATNRNNEKKNGSSGNLSDRPSESYLYAKLPVIHGSKELKILTVLATHDAKLRNSQWYYSPQFHEAQAPREGLITKDAGNHGLSRSCLKGPNILVANPMAQSCRIPCRVNADYDEINLTSIQEDFFPRTVFRITDKGLKSPQYKAQTEWGAVHNQQYRIISRQMVNPVSYRTFATAIIPPGPSHVNSLCTLSFQKEAELVYTSGLFNSLLFDFLMRSVSGGTIGKSMLELAPTLNVEQLANPLVNDLMIRALRLSCVTKHYKDLWQRSWQTEFQNSPSSSQDEIFAPKKPYSALKDTWDYDYALRDPKQREQALCEIDAIVALLFGVSKDDLIRLYRSQFGVLQNDLQDREGQKDIDSQKYHFPRAKQMEEAYDAFQKRYKQPVDKS